MGDLAQATLIGRLVRDPEGKDAAGSRVVNFSLAVNRKERGEDAVSYFDCEAWGNTADVVEKYCTKGKQVCVIGTLRIDRWETKDGDKRSKPVVKVGILQLLGGPTDPIPRKADEYVPTASHRSMPKHTPITEGDIPF